MNADYVWKLSKFGRLTSTRLRFDDDFADRLNYQITGLLLFVFVGIIGIRQYVGKPIQCWTPQEFTRAWEEYAENYCWVASTYFVHLSRNPIIHSNLYLTKSDLLSSGYIGLDGQHIIQPHSLYPNFPRPRPGELPSNGRLISYYQWAPIFLAVQSFLFYVPCLIWRLFASQSGFQVRRIMQLASEAAQAAPTEGDAPTQAQPSVADATNQTKIRSSLMVSANTGNPSSPGMNSSFAATKSVRTLARYLDMCLMRQRELRRAALTHRIRHSNRSHTKKHGVKKVASHDVINQNSSSNRTHDNDSSFSINNNNNRANLRSNVITDMSNVAELSVGRPIHYHHEPKTIDCNDLKCCCNLFKWNSQSKCELCQCFSSDSKKYHYQIYKMNKSKYASSIETGFTTNFPTLPNNFHQLNNHHHHHHNNNQNNNIINNSNLPNLYQTLPDPLISNELDNCQQLDCYCLTNSTNNSCKNNSNHYLTNCCKYQGNFLVRLYLLMKFLYVSNIIGQIYLLEYYTGVEYNFYGIRVLYDLARGRQWEESGHFPRVTFCDFEARKLAQSHYYTLQCVLPVNMFLEKIYIFLWLWFFVVGIITFTSVIIWITRLGTSKCRYAWIRHQLITIQQYNKDRKYCTQFVENHLGPDGVFLLRLIAQNYGDLVAGDTIGELWTAYWQRRSHVSVEVKGQESNSTLPHISVTEKAKNLQNPKSAKVVKSSSKNTLHGPYPQRMQVTNEQNEQQPKSKPKKERHRRSIMQMGYPSAMMLTQMMRPTDRFPVPLVTPTRRPPSIPSRSSSRYSQRSRSRDRSESPPPIPQRSPGDPSLSDRPSLHDYGPQSESTSAGQPIMPTEQNAEDGNYVSECQPEVVGQEIVSESREEFCNDDLPRDVYDENFDNRYADDLHTDDNIV